MCVRPSSGKRETPLRPFASLTRKWNARMWLLPVHACNASSTDVKTRDGREGVVVLGASRVPNAEAREAVGMAKLLAEAAKLRCCVKGACGERAGAAGGRRQAYCSLRRSAALCESLRAGSLSPFVSRVCGCVCVRAFFLVACTHRSRFHAPPPPPPCLIHPPCASASPL